MKALEMTSKGLVVSGAIAALGVLGTIGALASVGGCNAVLGIEEATVDPTIVLDGSTSDDGAIDSGTTDAGNPFTCASYCTNIMQNCTLDNQEYINRDICLAMCSHFELGVPGEQVNDSLACRVYHANAAAGDPAVHCRHAGPLGGEHCGDHPCDTYCLLESALCGGQPYDPFDGGESTCRVECPQFNYVAEGDAGDLTFRSSSNTLNCRLYHLESAYDLSNPAAQTTHCPHTGVASVGGCQ